jgi:hypothetical protein
VRHLSRGGSWSCGLRPSCLLAESKPRRPRGDGRERERRGAPSLLTPIVQARAYTRITARQELGNKARQEAHQDRQRRLRMDRHTDPRSGRGAQVGPSGQGSRQEQCQAPGKGPPLLAAQGAHILPVWSPDDDLYGPAQVQRQNIHVRLLHLLPSSSPHSRALRARSPLQGTRDRRPYCRHRRRTGSEAGVAGRMDQGQYRRRAPNPSRFGRTDPGLAGRTGESRAGAGTLHAAVDRRGHNRH